MRENVFDLETKLDPENRPQVVQYFYRQHANNRAGQNILGKVRHRPGRIRLHVLEGVDLDSIVIDDELLIVTFVEVIAWHLAGRRTICSCSYSPSGGLPRRPSCVLDGADF